VTAAKGVGSEGGTPVTLRALRYPVSLRRPFEQPLDSAQLRRRVLVFAGMWFLLAGMLAALGLVAVLLVSFALVFIGGALVGGAWLLRRYPVRPWLRSALSSIERAARDQQARLGGLGLRQRLRFATRHAPVVGQLRTRASQTFRTEPIAIDRQSQALRLNELGAQLRREGKYEEAAEQHRAALAIVRELGDRQAEALTLNNLALALVHSGGVAIAVQHFEQALDVLRELGDAEHEGRVIANLAVVRLRQGRDEDAESLLHAALDKLPPESSAYRQVEEQLRRAS
jgi:tetratricopeptide (TPR) repeat protein